MSNGKVVSLSDALIRKKAKDDLKTKQAESKIKSSLYKEGHDIARNINNKKDYYDTWKSFRESDDLGLKNLSSPKARSALLNQQMLSRVMSENTMIKALEEAIEDVARRRGDLESPVTKESIEELENLKKVIPDIKKDPMLLESSKYGKLKKALGNYALSKYIHVDKSPLEKYSKIGLVDEEISSMDNSLNKLNDKTVIVDESQYESPEEIEKKKKLREAALEDYNKTDLQRRAEVRNKELLPMDEWKKKYGPKYTNDVAEDMTEKLAPSIDEFKKAARMDKLKNLAKGLGKGLAEGAAWGVALDPSEIAPSELPYSQEDMDNLEAEMRMKNAPYNYPTRFEALRKKLGR